MAGRGFSPMEYFSARCAKRDPLFAFSAGSLTEAREWRLRAQAKARDLLGECPEPAPLDAEIIEQVDCGTYTRERIVFNADADSSVPGYVLIPKNLEQPAPAILCLHGHGPGKDVVAGVTNPDEHYTEENKRLFIQQHNCDYARQFAQRGFVTLTFDFRCFGERMECDLSVPGRDPCSIQFMRGCLLGSYALTLNLHDTARAVDYLETRPEVNRHLIGCVGMDLGGAVTLWATAMGKRIKAAVIGSYLCELSELALRQVGVCGSQILPDLYCYFDLCDVAALIPPKPLLIQSGIHDHDLPIESAQRSVARLKTAYAAWEHPEMLEHDVFAGGQEFHSKTAFEWFDRWLTNPQ